MYCFIANMYINKALCMLKVTVTENKLPQTYMTEAEVDSNIFSMYFLVRPGEVLVAGWLLWVCSEL